MSVIFDIIFDDNRKKLFKQSIFSIIASLNIIKTKKKCFVS